LPPGRTGYLIYVKRSRVRKLSGKPAGFTLTELLIVLLIIGIPFFIFFIKEVCVTEGYRFAASPYLYFLSMCPALFCIEN